MTINKFAIFILILHFNCIDSAANRENNATINNEQHFLRQVFQTGPLWTGENEELPAYVRDKFYEQNLHYVLSLPSSPPELRPTNVIQACFANSVMSTALKFTIIPTPADPNRITSAELHVFLYSHSTGQQNHAMLRVYQIVHNRPIQQPDSHRLLSIHVPTSPIPNPGQWITFNVLTAINDWIRNATKNLGFLFPDSPVFNISGYRPFLIIKYSSESGNINKVPFEIQGWRNVSSVNFDEAVEKRPCYRDSLILNFTQWGLIEPQELNIGQCQGSCNQDDVASFSAVHTAILSILASTQEPKLKKPCCVPSEYGPAPIMYRESNGNYIIRILQNVIARECLCK